VRECCLPTPTRGGGKPRPPCIEDYKQALRKKEKVTKISAKAIDYMAGVGNAAAHNADDFDPKEVPVLLRDVIAFLDRNSPT
jgi:hypothetical protein